MRYEVEPVSEFLFNFFVAFVIFSVVVGAIALDFFLLFHVAGFYTLLALVSEAALVTAIVRMDL